MLFEPKNIPGFGQPGVLEEFVRGLNEGEAIILCPGNSNWDYASMHPDGVLVQIEGEWYLNSTDFPRQKPADPDKYSRAHHVTIESKRINGGGTSAPARFHQYESHPHGVVFELNDGTLMLVVYNHDRITEITTDEDPPRALSEMNAAGGARM